MQYNTFVMKKAINLLRAVVIFSPLFLQIEAQHEQCFADISQPYVYFASKTSYFASRESQIHTPQSCTPTYLWALIRHGARYPNDERILSFMKTLPDLKTAIIQNHQDGRGNLCVKDVKNFKNWNISLSTNQNYQLTPQGRKEHIFLAQQLKKQFASLLKSPLNNSFEFQSSSSKRTIDSALAFSNELLTTNYTDIKGNNIIENELLRLTWSKCPRYLSEVENNSSTTAETKLLIQSKTMQKVISEISNRLGFEQPLSYDEIESMYLICAYENAWYLNSRPAFCAAFLPEQLKVFEYLDDIMYYYRNGYGTSSFTEEMACGVVKNMLSSLRNAAKKDNKSPKATFHFSHAEILAPTTVKLGLRRDSEPLKHDNYERMKETRKWRSSFFNSFAANIIAVLYKCPASDGTSEQNRVILYQNEREIEISKCTHNPCILEDLLENFQEVFDETRCNSKYCEIIQPVKSVESKGNANFSNFSVVLVIFLTSLNNLYK